jgi:hypothetical protein
MKYALIFAATLAALPAKADDMSAAEFFRRDRENNWAENSPYGSLQTAAVVPANKEKVAELITWHASEKLGPQWKATALKLAKIESNFNCGAVNKKSRASGVFQVMPRTAVAMGYDPKRLLECEYGIHAGIAHMERCIAAGVRTHRDMAACHVAGWGGWNKRLARKSERYKQKYIRLAMR